MNLNSPHTFHIPVMGLGYTIDTPAKVAQYGISSVVSIIEDHLVEQIRKLYCEKEGIPYKEITVDEDDYRALRITAYLNLLDIIVKKQISNIKIQPFETGNEIVKYFEMLPDESDVKQQYREMQNASGENKKKLENLLREYIVAGSIDVNIMTKLDKPNFSKKGEQLPVEYCDAMAALRGYANSTLSSSIVFSAGLNPRLYGYCATFNDFMPDANGNLKKRIILKVSDFRSAMIQGKFMAKKGLWISEFRIESGLNCGGHAFATDGLLLGPIMEEFKIKKESLSKELFDICNDAIAQQNQPLFKKIPELKITAQGGIGTANENKLLLEYYQINSTGWGSPFLLAPDVTNVDSETLYKLATAKKEDYYLSNASPLGIPFNNFHESSSEIQRRQRIAIDRPGSPCYLKFLSSDTEFTTSPICTASREYQNLKIKQLKEMNLTDKAFEKEYENITEKDCLCEGLGSAVLLKNHVTPKHKLKAVTICPGPNLAFFSGTFSLQEMVNHIYGRINILNSLPRPHMFINELQLYIDYLKKEIEKSFSELNARKINQLNTFKENLLIGIAYYKSLIPSMKSEAIQFRQQMKEDLANSESAIQEIKIPC